MKSSKHAPFAVHGLWIVYSCGFRVGVRLKPVPFFFCLRTDGWGSASSRFGCFLRRALGVILRPLLLFCLPFGLFFR